MTEIRDVYWNSEPDPLDTIVKVDPMSVTVNNRSPPLAKETCESISGSS